MRAVAIALALCLTAGAAAAEKIRASQSAKLFAKPGEQEKVLVKIKSGEAMTLLAREGRWIKVRIHGLTGYVPRSKVELPDDDEIARNTRRRPFVDGRGTKRGFGGDAGPDDRIGADATGLGGDDDSKKPSRAKDDDDDEGGGKKKPRKDKESKGGDDDEEDATPTKKPRGKDDVEVKDDDDDSSGKTEDDRPRAHVTEKTKVYDQRDKDSEVVFVAKPDMVLYPDEVKGKWTLVSDEEGTAGWVMTSQLDVDSGAGSGGGKRVRQIDLRARVGVTLLNQAMRSTVPAGTTSTFVDNYDLGTAMATVAVGATIKFPYKTSYLLVGELAYNLSDTLFGGVAPPKSAPMNSPATGIALHDLNLRGAFGIDLHKKNGTTFYARLGYRYESLQVANKNNPLLLPSEIFQGPTIGAALAIPRLFDKGGLKFSADALLFGSSIAQTAGLYDGTSPSAIAFLLGGQFIYKWKKDMDLQATYDLDYSSFSFGAAPAAPNNLRGHVGMNIGRTDLYHTLTFGIVRAF